jgi:hypothetical protein
MSSRARGVKFSFIDRSDGRRPQPPNRWQTHVALLAQGSPIHRSNVPNRLVLALPRCRQAPTSRGQSCLDRRAADAAQLRGLVRAIWSYHRNTSLGGAKKAVPFVRTKPQRSCFSAGAAPLRRRGFRGQAFARSNSYTVFDSRPRSVAEACAIAALFFSSSRWCVAQRQLTKRNLKTTHHPGENRVRRCRFVQDKMSVWTTRG